MVSNKKFTRLRLIFRQTKPQKKKKKAELLQNPYNYESINLHTHTLIKRKYICKEIIYSCKKREKN